MEPITPEPTLDFTGFEELEIGASGAVRRIWYAPATKRLRAEFPNRKDPSGLGAIYEYHDVPNEVPEALMEEVGKPKGSLGGLFHKLIKTGGYTYQCIREATAA